MQPQEAILSYKYSIIYLDPTGIIMCAHFMHAHIDSTIFSTFWVHPAPLIYTA